MIGLMSVYSRIQEVLMAIDELISGQMPPMFVFVFCVLKKIRSATRLV